MVNHAYWTNPAINKLCFEVAKAFTYLSFGAVFYDMILQASFDLSIISGKRQRRWPQVAFFATKIFWVAYTVDNLIILWSLSEIKCQSALNALEFLMGALVISSSCLLACRTVCVYQGTARSVVTAVLGVFALALVAAWMQGVPDITAMWTTEAAMPWNSGGCSWASVRDTYWVKYVITIIFDLLVLILTTVGIVRMNGGSRIGEILIHHGLIYFIFTFIANFIITVLTALKLSPTMSLIAAVPQSAICVLCSTRLYVKLAEEARPRPGGIASSQLSSGTGNKIASFFRSAGGSTANRNRKTGNVTAYAGSRDFPSDSSNGVSSIEDLEKSQTTSGNTIHVEQTRQVAVDDNSEHLIGHPFGNLISNQPPSLPATSSEANHADDDVPENNHSSDVLNSYPKLLANSRRKP